MPRPFATARRKRRPSSSWIEYTSRPASLRGFQSGGNSPTLPLEKFSTVTQSWAPACPTRHPKTDNTIATRNAISLAL